MSVSIDSTLLNPKAKELLNEILSCVNEYHSVLYLDDIIQILKTVIEIEKVVSIKEVPEKIPIRSGA